METTTATTGQVAADQEKPKSKKSRKTRLEKLAAAEQKLAAAQAEVDRLKAEEEKADISMKIKMASWIIDMMQGQKADDGALALCSMMTAIEEMAEKKMPKDLALWIKNKA